MNWYPKLPKPRLVLRKKGHSFLWRCSDSTGVAAYADTPAAAYESWARRWLR